VADLGGSEPLTKPFEKLKSVILFKKFIEYIHASCIYDTCIHTVHTYVCVTHA